MEKEDLDKWLLYRPWETEQRETTYLNAISEKKIPEHGSPHCALKHHIGEGNCIGLLSWIVCRRRSTRIVTLTVNEL